METTTNESQTAAELLTILEPLQRTVVDLTAKLDAERQRLGDLEVEYDAAAKALAEGDTRANPIEVQDRQQRAFALANGIEQLLDEAKAKVKPIQEAFSKARREENVRQEDDDIERFCRESEQRGVAMIEAELSAHQKFNALIRPLQDKAKHDFVNKQKSESRISHAIEHLCAARNKRLANF